MASWISATSAKQSIFNFIFNLGNKRLSGGDKSREYEGVIQSCNIFWGQKLAKTCGFVGWRIIMQQKKSWEQNVTGRTHWMHFRRWSITPLKNSAFAVFISGMNSLCTMPWESKKLSTWSWHGTFGISVSLAEGMFHQPIQNSVALFRGHRQNYQVPSPIIILLKNVCLHCPVR